VPLLKTVAESPRPESFYQLQLSKFGQAKSVFLTRHLNAGKHQGRLPEGQKEYLKFLNLVSQANQQVLYSFRDVVLLLEPYNFCAFTGAF
jgi:hypothetical protein